MCRALCWSPPFTPQQCRNARGAATWTLSPTALAATLQVGYDAPAPVILQDHQVPSSVAVMQHQTFYLNQSSSKVFAKVLSPVNMTFVINLPCSHKCLFYIVSCRVITAGSHCRIKAQLLQALL